MNDRPRFILVNSPIYWESASEGESYLPPLGLGYIATCLESAGVDVAVMDCVSERISVEGAIERLRHERPDYMGINSFTQNLGLVKAIVEGVGSACKCFVGGPAAKILYRDMLDWDAGDELNAIIGDGELIIPAIVRGECAQRAELSAGHGRVFRVDGESPYFPRDISNARLDRKYLGEWVVENHYGQPEAPIVSSRGCSFDCAFCGGARSLNADVPIRIRSVESLVAEIREIQALRPDVRCIRVLDDLFLRGAESMRSAAEVFGSFPGLSWRGMSHILPVNRNIELLRPLADSGCKELFVGIESGSEAMRKRINKLGSPEDVINAACAILGAGIDLKGYFIFGFPGETELDFRATYELAATIRNLSATRPGSFRTSAFQFRPYHGTRLYNELVASGVRVGEMRRSVGLAAEPGRAQFSFDSGNYSAEPDEVLHGYIERTQGLGRQ